MKPVLRCAEECLHAVIHIGDNAQKKEHKTKEIYCADFTGKAIRLIQHF